MNRYKINEKFPIPNPIPNTDNVRSDINSEFINIIHNITLPTTKEVRLWSQGNFKYGVFTESDIPFFLIDFDGWDLDVSLNVLRITNNNQRDLWLKINRGWLNMFLVDACNNELVSMRNIFFTDTNKFKQILQRQANRYKNDSEVDLEIVRIYSKYSIKDMIKRTKMIKIK